MMSQREYSDRGIVLLAIGSPYYGQWAINMALSIRYYNSSIPIQIIHDRKAFERLDRYMKVFDIKTEMNPDHIRRGGIYEPGRAKLHLYRYLAFEKNIYLDVDGICVKDIEPLFDECKSFYLTQTHDYIPKGQGKHPQMKWMDTDILWQDFGFDDDAILPATNTSFQYIEKGDSAKQFYDTALDACESGYTARDLKENGLTWGMTKSQPDELYINIACAKLKHDCGGVAPIYFTSRLRGDHAKTFEQIKSEFYLIGLWGDMRLNITQVREMYDPLNQKHWHKLIKMNPEFKLNRIIKNKFVTNKIR